MGSVNFHPSEGKVSKYVVFRLDDQDHGLPLTSVDRIVRAVAVTPLPNPPASVLGVINVQGQIIPVVSLRRLYGLADREIALSDQFIIAHTSRRAAALVVDAVTGVVDYGERDIIVADDILHDLDQMEAVSKHADGNVILHSLDKLLSDIILNTMNEPQGDRVQQFALHESRE
jgi:purine-binding chemotaxis protein CheW